MDNSELGNQLFTKRYLTPTLVSDVFGITDEEFLAGLEVEKCVGFPRIITTVQEDVSTDKFQINRETHLIFVLDNKLYLVTPEPTIKFTQVNKKMKTVHTKPFQIPYHCKAFYWVVNSRKCTLKDDSIKFDLKLSHYSQ